MCLIKSIRIFSQIHWKSVRLTVSLKCYFFFLAKDFSPTFFWMKRLRPLSAKLWCHCLSLTGTPESSWQETTCRYRICPFLFLPSWYLDREISSEIILLVSSSTVDRNRCLCVIGLTHVGGGWVWFDSALIRVKSVCVMSRSLEENL